jgi:exo-beta-1,3-glucanase (GH17 family)
MKRTLTILLTLSVLVLVNFIIWRYINNPLQLRSWTKTTMGVTFDPRRKEYTQKNGQYPTEAEIDADLAVLENKIHSVRTYSVLKGFHKIPELAAKHGLNTTVGAWIDGDREKNRQEIETLLQVSNQNNNKIVRVMVGNEVLFRNDIPVQQLIDYIREVQEQTLQPVSTSEPFDIWLKHPELVAEVDFIGVEIHPFWEGVAVENVVNFVFDKYEAVKKAYPNKPIVITEVGWPSDGQPSRQAIASRTNQAFFLREFLNRAAEQKIPYYIVEAFDQPWKMEIEGSAGAYWGIFNTNRQPKYPMDGAESTLSNINRSEIAVVTVCVIMASLFLSAHQSFALPVILFFGFITILELFVPLIFSVNLAGFEELTIFLNYVLLILLAFILLWLLIGYCKKLIKENEEKQINILNEESINIEAEGFQGIDGVIELFSQFQIDKGEVLFKKYLKFQDIGTADLQILFESLESFLYPFEYRIGNTYTDYLSAIKLIASDLIGYRIVIQHRNILIKKYKQLVYKDDYGNLIKTDFDSELKYFKENVLKKDTKYSEAISRYIEPYFHQKITERVKKECPGADTTSNEEVRKKIHEIVQNHISEASDLYIDFILNENCRMLNIYDNDRNNETTENPDSAEELSPYDYEKLCEEQLKKAGWKASITKKGADQGADVIASHNDFELVLQCKQYNGVVGNNAVQEAIAAREYYQTNAAAVVSNATFTKPARQLASAAGVLLLHHSELMTLHPNNFRH